MSKLYPMLAQALENEELVALCTIISGPGSGRKRLVWPGGRSEGDLGSPDLNSQVQEHTAGLLEEQKSQRVPLELEDGRREVFIDVFPPPPKLILVGAVHVAIPLIIMARELGFRTIVIDPRTAFATPERFAHADELRVGWPQEVLSPDDFNEATYLAVLSHDEKLDNPALRMALENPCRYIGALGSRKTHARRVKSLREMGITEEQISAMHAPIGLNLGGRLPAEIAIAILAQIVAVRNGAPARSNKS